MDARIPAHLEISGLIRAVGSAGGFATVLQSGERDAGTILIVTRARDEISRLYERMPDLEGGRRWICARQEDLENQRDFEEYLERRRTSDPDCWLIELDVARAERFIALPGTQT